MISTLTLFLYNMMFGGRVGEDEDEPDAPPGAAPVPIDQGPLDTCTRYRRFRTELYVMIISKKNFYDVGQGYEHWRKTSFFFFDLTTLLT